MSFCFHTSTPNIPNDSLSIPNPTQYLFCTQPQPLNTFLSKHRKSSHYCWYMEIVFTLERRRRPQYPNHTFSMTLGPQNMWLEEQQYHERYCGMVRVSSNGCGRKRERDRESVVILLSCGHDYGCGMGYWADIEEEHILVRRSRWTCHSTIAQYIIIFVFCCSTD